VTEAKAEEQGTASEKNKIDTKYYFGQGISKNYKQAVTWNRKAAKQYIVMQNLPLNA